MRRGEEHHLVKMLMCWFGIIQRQARVSAHLNFLISDSAAGSPVSNKLQHFYVNKCPFLLLNYNRLIHESLCICYSKHLAYRVFSGIIFWWIKKGASPTENHEESDWFEVDWLIKTSLKNVTKIQKQSCIKDIVFLEICLMSLNFKNSSIDALSHTRF